MTRFFCVFIHLFGTVEVDVANGAMPTTGFAVWMIAMMLVIMSLICGPFFLVNYTVIIGVHDAEEFIKLIRWKIRILREEGFRFIRINRAVSVSINILISSRITSCGAGNKRKTI